MKTDVELARTWRRARLAARRYEESGIPLYAWESAAIALAAGVPMPQAVLAYVVRCARELGAPRPGGIGKPGSHVLKCLEIGGAGPSAFERRRRFELDRGIREIAAKIRENTQMAMADALSQAAEDRARDPESLARQARRRRGGQIPP